MKGIIAVAFMAMVFAAVKAEDLKGKIAQVFSGCKDKNPISDAELDAMRKTDLDFAYSQNAKCMIACMLEEGKMMKDGKYLKENALIMADVFHADDFDEGVKAKQVIEICTGEVSEVGPDPCEFAYKMAICGGKQSKKLGMKKHEFFE